MMFILCTEERLESSVFICDTRPAYTIRTPTTSDARRSYLPVHWLFHCCFEQFTPLPFPANATRCGASVDGCGGER